MNPTPPVHTFALPAEKSNELLKFFADSLEVAYDGHGVPFVAVECNDRSHAPGCAVFRMLPDGSLKEVLCTGEAGTYKPRIRIRGDGTAALFSVDKDGKHVNVWTVPEFVPHAKVQP